MEEDHEEEAVQFDPREFEEVWDGYSELLQEDEVEDQWDGYSELL